MTGFVDVLLRSLILAAQAAGVGGVVFALWTLRGPAGRGADLARAWTLVAAGAVTLLIAQSLSLVLVQRLVRRLCSICAKSEPPAPVLHESLVARGLAEAGPRVALPRAVGCDACGNTGFQGRVAVIESLKITDDVRDALMAEKSLADIEKIAVQGKALFSFHACTAYLMARGAIGAADALLAVAG